MHKYVTINEKIKSFKKNIEVDSDKSLSIRSILIASQAIGLSKIANLLKSEDVINALKAIKKLGINYKFKSNILEINGYGINGFNVKKNTIINAGNSGTLARLILGLLIKTNKKIKLIGDKSLSKRDFLRVSEPLSLFGANIKLKKNSLPLEIEGTKFLRPIDYIENRGSAQCKSAVILAALNTPGITKIKAKKSRNHTEIFFKQLNIPIKIRSNGKYDLIEVRGLQQFKSFNYKIPGDISSSAFFIVLTLLSNKSEIIIRRVNINKSRIGIIKILNKMNAQIKYKNKKTYKGEEVADIYVKSVKKFKPIDCPATLNSSAIDEFLVIFLIAAKANGISTFNNLGELNKKESPRLDIAVKILKMIGIKVKRYKDNINIYGNPNLNLNGNFHIKNYQKDHRVAMTAVIAALSYGGNWKIEDLKESIKTSFPNFLKIVKILGAKINWKITKIL